MVKRLISANSSEILAMTSKELKQSIKASEGRTILSENVVIHEAADGITTSEIAASFGADLILLNVFDVFNPMILGLYPGQDNLLTAKVNKSGTIIKDLKHLVGRPIGLNLEPVDTSANMAEDRLVIPKGRTATEESFKQAEKLGFDFVCLTGNPGTGVTNKQINNAIKVAKKNFNGLIIAGKMHGAGVAEKVITKQDVESFISNGADIILTPAVGTVPGFDDDNLREIVKYVHNNDGLVMSAIGTSQEGAGVDYIESVALRNKIDGVDIQHIGDAAWGIQSPFENIYPLSRTIRGERHTVSRMARSVNR